MRNTIKTTRPSDHKYGIPNEEGYISDLLGYMYTRKDHYFLNDSLGHATLLADLMIGAAEKYVLIYTGSLAEECYKFAIDSLDESVKIFVLYDKEPSHIWWSDKPQITAVLAKSRPQLKNGNVNHFFVVDGKAFRYEIDHSKATASANFSQEDVCKGLTQVFVAAWRESSDNDPKLEQFLNNV